MSQKIGDVFVEISASADKLRADLQSIKQESAVAGQKIGQALSDGIATPIKQAVRPARDVLAAVRQVTGLVVGTLGTIGLIVGAITAVVAGVRAWVNAQENAAKAARDARGEIEKANDAIRRGLLDAKIDAADNGSKEQIELKIQALRLDKEAAIEAERRRIEEDETAKKLRDRIKSLNDIVQRADFQGVGSRAFLEAKKKELDAVEREYAHLFGQTIPAIEEQFATREQTIRKNAARDEITARQKGLDEMAERAAKFQQEQADQNIADLIRFQEFEEQRDEKRKRKREEALRAEREAYNAIADEFNAKMRSGAEAFREAILSVNSGSDRIGQSAKYLATVIKEATRAVETIRAQQARL